MVGVTRTDSGTLGHAAPGAVEALARREMERATGSPTLEGNHVGLQFEGGNTFDAWLEAIDAAERFGALTPGGLVLTKLDETDAIGEVLGFAMEQPMPVMFTTAGQEVPEDIDPAPPSALADRMLGVGAEPARVGS